MVDRIALPYVDTVVSGIGTTNTPPTSTPPVDRPPTIPPEPTQQINGTSDYFHLASHELRTIELERLPKGARRVLSVGANGRWYFDWFEKAVGAVDEHLGVEAYEPEPDDLQSYVTWIPDTADHMVGVSDSSVDVVFAGQTTEHLWSHELSGFLEEAHRVLRHNGLLVLDSPNRLVTEHLWWSHGGHTVELSVGEIVELVTLAGFEVASEAGIWRCEIDGRRLSLEEGIDDPATFVRRVTTAHDFPDQSFIWWVTARRLDVEIDRARLKERAKEIFERHWNTRICRGLFPSPGATRLLIAAGASGSLGSTLPFPLKQGQIQLTVSLAAGDWDQVDGLHLDLVTPGDHLVRRLVADDAHRDGPRLTWTFDQSELVFTVSLQIHVTSVRVDAVLSLPIDLRCDI